jgi:hypothetical protein
MSDRSKLDTYIAEIEEAAYKRGVADTWAKIKARLEDFSDSINRLQADALFSEPADSESEEPGDVEHNREPRDGSDQAKVLMAIRETPGIRGVDVVNALSGSVGERTVRTALFRLKRRGAIVQKEGKWIPSIPLFEKIEGQSHVR